MAVVLALSVALVAVGLTGPALAGKPTIMKGCKACHTAKPDVVRGKLVSYSPKFKSIQVNVGPLVWIIKYDASTQFTGTEDIAKVKKGKEMSVTFTGTGDDPMASVVSIKPPFEIPEEKLVSAGEMQEMVNKGLEGVLLIDSRPPAAYASGHVPGAKNLPYPKLNKMRERVLPADKDAYIVFYCGGFA
jgi:hypothetical protein